MEINRKERKERRDQKRKSAEPRRGNSGKAETEWKIEDGDENEDEEDF